MRASYGTLPVGEEAHMRGYALPLCATALIVALIVSLYVRGIDGLMCGGC